MRDVLSMKKIFANKLACSLIFILGSAVCQLGFCQTTTDESGIDVSTRNGKGLLAVEGIKSEIRLAKSASLYIVSPGIFFLTKLDEARVKEIGCRYATEDLAAVKNLVEIIEAVNLRTASFSADDFEPREAIYLTLRDGKTVALLFGLAEPGRQAVLGKVDGISVAADKHIADDLYRWAKGVDLVKKTSYCSAM